MMSGNGWPQHSPQRIRYTVQCDIPHFLSFYKQHWQIVKKQEERPSLRSVANAIRTGIFIEKIYSKMSTSQMMVIPPEVSLHLQTIENWSFDLFKFAKSANGSPLKFMGE